MAINAVSGFTVGNLAFAILSRASDKKQGHNKVTIDLSLDRDFYNFRILGGGGRVICDDAQTGAFLSAMYPEEDDDEVSGRKWIVESRDHLIPFPHQLIAFAVCARTNDGKLIPQASYKSKSLKSDLADHPFKVVTLPDGFILVGGGAETKGAPDKGQLLTASCPGPEGESWLAKSKDHIVPDRPSVIRVHAIGLKRDFLEKNNVMVVRSGPNESIRQSHPRTAQTIPGRIIGGGAEDKYKSETAGGNMLSGSFPSETPKPPKPIKLWQVEGRDHIVPDPAVIRAYAIGVVDLSCFEKCVDSM